MASMRLYGAAAASGQALCVPTSAAIGVRPARRAIGGLVVSAATVVAPKYTTVKPLADRVLLKTKTAELKTTGGILLPLTAQSKPQSGEVVAVGEGRIIGDSKLEVSIQVGAQDLRLYIGGFE